MESQVDICQRSSSYILIGQYWSYSACFQRFSRASWYSSSQNCALYATDTLPKTQHRDINKQINTFIQLYHDDIHNEWVIMHITGLLSSLGVRGSCWLISVVSESCSDTATNQKQIILHTSSLTLWIIVDRGHTCTLTSFASLSGESHRQLTLYLEKGQNQVTCTSLMGFFF